MLDVERLDTVEARNDLRAAVRIAGENQITLCLSNPAFEVWILAHFIRSSRFFNDCDAVILELNKHWKREFRIEYAKNDHRIYDRVADRVPQAIENAREVREQDHGEKGDIAACNSATDMYRLAEYLTR